MNQSSSLVKLAQKILDEAKKLEDGTVDEESTRALFEATWELQTSVMTIPRLLENHQFHYQYLSCLGWLVKFKIFNYVPIDFSSISYTDLAKKAGVPVKLLQSVVRMVMTEGIFLEPSPTETTHNQLSASLATNTSFQDWTTWATQYGMSTASQFAEATAKWPSAVANNETAFNVAFDTDLPLWEYMKTKPEMKETLSGYMRGTSQGSGGRLQPLVDGLDWASLGEATVVDVGGSTAHVSLALASAFPHLHFIVQDLPEVVQEGKALIAHLASDAVASRIRFAVHDFLHLSNLKVADQLQMSIYCVEFYTTGQMSKPARFCSILPSPCGTGAIHEPASSLWMQLFPRLERSVGVRNAPYAFVT